MWATLERDAASLDAQPALRAALDALVAQVPVARTITDTWLDVERQGGDGTWRAHEDINGVMLATALVPSGFLELS